MSRRIKGKSEDVEINVETHSLVYVRSKAVCFIYLEPDIYIKKLVQL